MPNPSTRLRHFLRVRYSATWKAISSDWSWLSRGSPRVSQRRRTTAVRLTVTNQDAGGTAFDCGGPGLLMCPSDSALTDAEPFDSSASLPAREVLSDLEGHFERLVVVESRVDEGLVATPQTFVI